MTDSDAENPASRGSRVGAAAARLWHWLLVTVGLRPDPRREAIRAVTLACVVGLGFALLGTVRNSALASFLIESPVDLDHSLRALTLGWFSSERTVPITIVDIDEATHQGWGSLAITPRDRLTRMLEVVTAAKPTAVVVDIDLSWGDGASVAADDGSRALLGFLQRYAGPAPLIFPKRVEPAPDGTRRLASSPFDEVFGGNSRLAWAHASFETDDGGAVRNWQDWLEVCTSAGAEWLPSVAVRLAAVIDTLPQGLDRPAAVTTRDRPCGAASGESVLEPKRLLIGPRLTGEGRAAPTADAQTIPASLLVDPDLSRDDARLFGERVVLIGATHASSGDFWLTPSGVLPGVELLANTVRFAPLQVEMQGDTAQLAYRCTALLLFAVFACLHWWLRVLLAFAFATIFTLVLVAFAIDRYDAFRVFDAVEAAILMMILYKATELLLKYFDELVAVHSRSPAGRQGWLKVLRAAFVRKHEPRPPGD